jgi:hypothetical protein
MSQSVQDLEKRIAEAQAQRNPIWRQLQRKLDELKTIVPAKTSVLRVEAAVFVPKDEAPRQEEKSRYSKHTPHRVYTDHWEPLIDGISTLTAQEKQDLKGALYFTLSKMHLGLLGMAAATMQLETGKEREQAQRELMGLIPCACSSTAGFMFPRDLSRRAVYAICV